MADSNFIQSSFLGGEWSPYFQGRFDHPKYRTAMKLCRNALPIEEGAAVRRGGTNFMAPTRNGAAGRVVSFDIEQTNPYQIEFTDGHIRLFAGRSLVFTPDATTVTQINTANPAIMTLSTPVNWATGDQIGLAFSGGATSSNGAILKNRQFALTKIDTTHFSLADPITGLGVDGSTVNWNPAVVTLTATRVLDFASPYTSGVWKNVRRVQNENTAILLTSTVAPEVLALPQSGSSNQFAPFTLSALNFIDGPYLDPIAGSQATPGAASGTITVSIAWQPWSSTATYALGDIVTSGGQDYQSLVAGNINHTPASSPTYWTLTQPGSAVGIQGFVASDIGRQIRLFSEPAAWSSAATYAVGNTVKYNGLYWTSLLSNPANHGKVPGTWLLYWALSPAAAAWTWGKITAINSPNSVQVQILGAPLLNGTTVVNVWRLGAYSNTTGWPTCGTFHEGRLWLSGAIPNRFDASESNGDEFLPGVTNTWSFSPTEPDGTVADNDGITYTFRSPDKNTVLWMEPDHAGIVCGTIKGEWLIQASQLNDPLTPTSIQAHRVTKYQCADIEPQRTGLTLCFVQAYQRKLMEFFPDVFTGKFTAPNLSEAAKHMTKTGLQEIRYTRELVPCVWGRTGDGRLLGCTYKRDALMSSQPANFVGWHQHTLGSGRLVESISVGPTPDGTADTLVMVTNDPMTNIRHVEMLTNPVDQGATIYQSWFVDDAVTPAGSSTTATGVTFYGLWHLNGKMVTIFVGGLDLGDFTVANGAVTVPFGANPLFTQAYLNSISGSNYGDFATNIDTTITTVPPPPITGTSANGVVLGYVGSPLTITDLAAAKAFPDFTNNVLYIHESQAGGSEPSPWRTFNLLTGTETAEHLGVAGDANGPAAFDGKRLYTMDNGNANFVYKINPSTMATVATFGTATDAFGDFGDQSGVVPQATSLAPISSFAHYLLAVGGINDTGTVLNTDTMQFAGHTFAFANDGNRSGRYCAPGYTTTDGAGNYTGTAFTAWNKNDGLGGPTTALYIYRTTAVSTEQLAIGNQGGLLSDLLNPLSLFGGGTPTVPYRIGADTYGTALAWDPAIRYQVGDIVSSASNVLGAAYFICNVANTGAIPIIYPSLTGAQYATLFWQPLGPSTLTGTQSPTGVGTGALAWDVGTTYYEGDATISRGVPTKCQLSTSTGADPNRGILTPAWQFVPNGWITTVLIKGVGVLPTAVDATWSSINFDGMVLDQVDNNLIMHVNTTDSVAQKNYVIKVNSADGAVMWKVATNAVAIDPVSMGVGRVVNGVYAFLSDPATGGVRNVYVLNTLTGALQQTLTVKGIAPGQGQFFDDVGGLIYVIASYTQATGTPTPYKLTPSSYTNKWTAFWPANAATNNVFQGTTTSVSRDTLPVAIGFSFVTQCQILRPNTEPEIKSPTGPALAKMRRTHQFGALVDGTGVGGDLKFGTDFDHLRAADFRSKGEKAPLVTALYSDILWTTLDDDFSFNSEFCWQITRPFPVNVMAIGEFLNTQDR